MWNGWSSWETYAVAKWVQETPEVYVAMRRGRPFDGWSAMRFVMTLAPSGVPDFATDKLNHGYGAVDWDELAEYFNQT